MVRLSSLRQHIAPQESENDQEAEGALAGAGLLTTELQWELSGSDCSPATGSFTVNGGYQLNTKGDLELTHSEYVNLTLLPGSLDRLTPIKVVSVRWHSKGAIGDTLAFAVLVLVHRAFYPPLQGYFCLRHHHIIGCYQTGTSSTQ